MQTVKKGMVCRHHSGRVYTILDVANATNPSEKFPRTVIYMGANGNIWARNEKEFLEKFELLFDGTQLADN